MEADQGDTEIDNTDGEAVGIDPRGWLWPLNKNRRRTHNPEVGYAPDGTVLGVVLRSKGVRAVWPVPRGAAR